MVDSTALLPDLNEILVGRGARGLLTLGIPFVDDDARETRVADGAAATLLPNGDRGRFVDERD